MTRRDRTTIGEQWIRDQLRRHPREWAAPPPRQVLLFSGHMIDAPGREIPRFPAHQEAAAAAAIHGILTRLAAGPQDLGVCGGACGGDLIFAEACLDLGTTVEIRIPFDVATFVRESVSFAGHEWRDRFYRTIANRQCVLYSMPQLLDPLPKGANPYEQLNLWQLYSAAAWGGERVRFICLWDGQGGDGPGGTRHMFESVKRLSGRIYLLDTNRLFTGVFPHRRQADP